MPFITVKGKMMFFEEEGDGFPLLFGHSYLWDAAMWKPQVAELAKSYRCIVPEIWGHGRSDVLPGRPYSIEELAEDHWIFARALGLEQFAVIGLSVGGMWGAHMALAHPEAVTALVLMDTYTGPEPDESMTRYFRMLDIVEQAAAIPPDLVKTLVPLFFSPATMRSHHDFVDGFKDKLASVRAEMVPSIVDIGRGIFSRKSILDRLSGLNIPALVIVGADDSARPPEESRRMAQLIRNAQLVVVPEAGHICNLEQPELVNRLLVRFLNKVLTA